MSAITTDTFFEGRIQVKQHQRGYRFAVDAIILAHHVHPRPQSVIADLGAGCGIIPLILAYRHPQIRIHGIEIQPELAELAVRNVEDNALQDRIQIHRMDLKSPEIRRIPVTYDIVVSNPPYRKADSGRINPNLQRAVARHELETSLSDWLSAAGTLLRKGGKFVIVYTADRIVELLLQMQTAGIEPKSLRAIHSGPKTEAKLIVVEGAKGGRPGTKVLSPLIVYRSDGSYTEEMERMFAP
jgi:tRNA1Val (adenine37-N6)-methyltransferase